MSKNTDLARSYDLKAPIASPVFTGDLRADRLIAYGSGGSSTSTAIGYYALQSNTSGHHNIAIGMNTLYGNETGYSNTACGFDALTDNTENNNTGNGFNALRNNITGSNNVAVGAYSLNSITGGNTPNTASSNCTGLGYNTKVGGNNATAIGYSASAPANCVALGTSNERTLVGTSTDNGVDRLQVNGSISANRITVGNGTSFGMALSGNQDWSTGINANGGGAGRLVTVMLSANWSSGDGTGASFGYIRCGYSGNHATYYNQWASQSSMIPTITVDEAGIIIINVPTGGNIYAFFQTNK